MTWALKDRVKCPFVELHRKLLSERGGGAPMGWHSGGAVFSRPQVIFDLKVKVICDIWQ
jgi:hypothetical protein